MAKKIKIHYYTVSSNCGTELEDLLSDLHSMTLAERTRTVNQGDVCLETVDEYDGFWFLHFTSARRSNWPGVGIRGQPSTDLILTGDAQLTENTFAAFDPQSGKLTVQYTQHSVRPSRMFRYFDSFTGAASSYSYMTVLNRDALERYEQMTTYTRVDAVVHNVTPGDIADFDGAPIHSSVRESVEAGIAHIEISFKANARIRGNRVQRSFIQRLIAPFIERDSSRDKVVVYGRSTDDSPIEEVDLLRDAKTRYYLETTIALTSGNRYSPDSMRDILFDALRN